MPFAGAIVDGLRARGLRARDRAIDPGPVDEYPTRAKRPLNSRLISGAGAGINLNTAALANRAGTRAR